MAGSRAFGRPLDTPADVVARQSAIWRAMSPDQKARLVTSLSRATWQLAEAGIRARYPAASTRERFLRLAILRLGRSLAFEVYPEAERLVP